MIDLAHAQQLVADYARRARAIDFGTGIVERPDYWFFPIGFTGSSGVIVDKSDGRLTVQGSVNSVEDCCWAHERGLYADQTSLTVTRIHDLPQTIEFLLYMTEDGPPRRPNPNPLRTWLATRLQTLPATFATGRVWLWIRSFRDAERAGWFEFDLRATPPG